MPFIHHWSQTFNSRVVGIDITSSYQSWCVRISKFPLHRLHMVADSFKLHVCSLAMKMIVMYEVRVKKAAFGKLPLKRMMINPYIWPFVMCISYGQLGSL